MAILQFLSLRWQPVLLPAPAADIPLAAVTAPTPNGVCTSVEPIESPFASSVPHLERHFGLQRTSPDYKKPPEDFHYYQLHLQLPGMPASRSVILDGHRASCGT